jgi:hypothetical protein
VSRVELRKQWEQRIRVFRASGQGVAAWCAAHDISVATFHYWLRRFPLLPPSVPAPAPVRFLELDMASIPAPEDLSLTLRVGAVTIDVPPGFDPALLRQVVGILTTIC